MKKNEAILALCYVLGILSVVSFGINADSFTETFANAVYKDAGSTTASWGPAEIRLVPSTLGATEKPLTGYTPTAGVSTGDEVGYRFQALVDGNVTKLGRYSYNTGNTVVSLWSDSGSLMAQGTVPAVTGWQWATLPTPVGLTGGSYYRVTVNCGSAYCDDTTIAYPSTIGNIKLTGYCFNQTQGLFPSTLGGTNDMLGAPDIEFQPITLYETPKGAQSLTVDNTASNIVTVIITPTQNTPANTTISYEISANGGLNWYSVSTGTLYNFPTAGIGSDLRWKATLNTTNTATSPSIDQLVMVYYTIPISGTDSFTDLVSLQLDGDAEYEFAGGNIGGEVYAMDNDGTFKWSRTGLGYIMSLSAGDVNAD
ncbi:DUF4082 domain-containing protein, partial [Candidatus Woesearchaeota archaeon]|nr:DUF4082 domain-containing protein [Candidatus Woesearchaeota archaeon]